MPATATLSTSDPVWNGADFLAAFDFATRWLDHNRETINGLNVFPIPDGDTGTNMALTMRAARDAVADAALPSTVSDIAALLAHGALMGARGNSGVILSQILRGFADGVEDAESLTGSVLANALTAAAHMAYKAVIQPVEGTMLTVVRMAAEAATTTAQDSTALIPVLWDSLDAARAALAQTPEQLDVLRQAGVVDAGGQGIVFILEGFLRYAQGNTFIVDEGNAISTGARMQFLDTMDDLHGEDPFGYCTNFMVFGKHLDFTRIREIIAGMGQSAVIVGDDTLIKVHIHTEHPGEVLEYALSLGYLDQIKIDNMSLQTEALTHQREAARQSAVDAELPTIDGPIGIIAVAAGSGIGDALKAMGAHVIIPGGQTQNPSTEEFLAAAQRMPVDEIIILPNNKNIILAATQMQSLTEKSVRIIPTRSVAQGLAALATFIRDAPLDTNVEHMIAAIELVHSIDITRAVRDVELNGVAVKEDDVIGIVDGNIVAADPDLARTATETLQALHSLNGFAPELLTIFTGEGATPETTTAIESTASDIFPDAEIEILEGDQPHYPYLISAE